MTTRYRLKKDWMHPEGVTLRRGKVLQFDRNVYLYPWSVDETDYIKLNTAFIEANPDLFEPVPEEPEAPKMWRAKKDRGYYFIGLSGSINNEWEEGAGFDDALYNAGNYFKTPEQAEKYAKKEKARRLLQQYADQVNGDWKPEWHDGEGQRYGIYYNQLRVGPCLEATRIYFKEDVPVFKTQELALQAIKDMREQLNILFELN